jgi:uncharacterized protein DUF4160
MLIETRAEMAKVYTSGKTEIRVYANDHLPPHFHIVNPDFEALIVFEDFSTYAGAIKGAASKHAIEWAKANIAVIKAEWNRVNPRFPTK